LRDVVEVLIVKEMRLENGKEKMENGKWKERKGTGRETPHTPGVFAKEFGMD